MLTYELNDEQWAKAEEIKTPEEAFAFAKQAGVELTEDQLDQISGGWGSGGSDPKPEVRCPYCGYTKFTAVGVQDGRGNEFGGYKRCWNCERIYDEWGKYELEDDD